MLKEALKNSKLETEPIIVTKEWLYEFYGIAKKKDEFQMEKFQEKYEGITISKHYNGKTLKNSFGKCYHISTKTEIEIFEPNHDKVKQKLLLDLKAITGIAEITENNLKLEGITSISQLENHYRYGNEAKKYINYVENKNATKIYEQLSSRFTSSNPLLLANSALFNLSDIIFIDIETLGLGDIPLFLIGIATFKDKYLIIDQIFTRELNEEKAALHFLAKLIKGKKAIGTFNGKSFDLPFIRRRMKRHDLKHEINLPHFDLKYLSQKAFSNFVYNFKLSTLEKFFFNIERIDDVAGGEIPFYYKSYLKTKNIGSVVPIIDHNKQDLISTAKLFMKLHDFWS
jgi:uncharacterized protein